MAKIKKKPIKLNVNLIPTNEIFKLNLLFPTSLIRDLRSESEISTGIPSNIQQLYYLDKCDLVDDTTIQSNEIVSNAILSLDVWHNWRDLVVAVVKDDINRVFSLGVTQDSKFESPSSAILSEKERRAWIQERANIALMIAGHRGHLTLCKELIKQGSNVNWTTKLGRTALHLAAARDKGDIIDLLLHNGADIDLQDANGFTAMTLANKYGHKGCERHLFMFRWQQRAKDMDSKYLNPPPMAFQLVDSFKKNWKTGPAAQFYIQKLLPPGEFIGSAFNAPKRNWHRRLSEPDLSTNFDPDNAEAESQKKKSIGFDQWMRQKSTQQRIHRDIQKKKEDSEKSVEEEKRRQRVAKWKASHPANDSDMDVAVVRLDGSDALLSSTADPRPSMDTKTRIKELLLKFGLKDTGETPKTVYEQWLIHKRNMGQGAVNETHSSSEGHLQYQQMIKEFCEQRCHRHVRLA